jgi:hypothetical protein
MPNTTADGVWRRDVSVKLLLEQTEHEAADLNLCDGVHRCASAVVRTQVLFLSHYLTQMRESEWNEGFKLEKYGGTDFICLLCLGSKFSSDKLRCLFKSPRFP